jgi:chaperone BCS1
MDALKSLVQPLVGGGMGGSSGVVDGMKLVVLGGTVETARRVSSSAWSHFVNSFFLTAHFSEEDYPYDWLMFWLARRPEWQRSREFEATTRTTTPGASSRSSDFSFGDEDLDEAAAEDDDMTPGKVKTRVLFQPTFDTTHTIYYKGHLLRVKRGRKGDGDMTEMLSISVVARSNTILKQLVLQAKKEYEAESVHRIQIYFADSHGSWRWSDSRHKRPMSSIVLNPGVKEMLLGDTRDFLKSEKWYADRGIPFRRGYLLHGVPGSGKSSLIHAIAGELMLDIYVVSLSSSWMNDSTLQTLMGRVPARCIVLLEDLDAAFTRSTSRDANAGNGKGDNAGEEKETGNSGNSGNSGSKKKKADQMSDVNTLSLSGLLNALDGVAAAEGRILFATTNHLERLDPALSRPGRMDVWIEFKNASRWQAEALFRNFFPSIEDINRRDNAASGNADDADDIILDPGELDAIDIPGSPHPNSSSSGSQSEVSSQCGSKRDSSWWSMSPTASSVSLLSSPSSVASPLTANSSKQSNGSVNGSNRGSVKMSPEDFGAKNQAYLPPPVAQEEQITHSAKPLDAATLSRLAKQFADSLPDEEFSVAALQGYLLRNKSQPAAAASGAAEWVRSEIEMRERLKREREERELKDRMEREKRKREIVEREREKKELELKEVELLKMRQQLHETANAAAAANAASAAAAAPAPPAPSSADVEKLRKAEQEKKDLEAKIKAKEEEDKAKAVADADDEDESEETSGAPVASRNAAADDWGTVI